MSLDNQIAEPSDDHSRDLLIEKGETCRRNKDYESAFSCFMQADELYNDSVAQYNLGLMHFHGDGRVFDNIKALSWFEKAIENKSTNANLYIGHIYFNGKFGVNVDYAKALQWYFKAADASIYKDCKKDCKIFEARAQLQIGKIYFYGFDTSVDHTLALQWFIKATENGLDDAMDFIFKEYLHKTPVPGIDHLSILRCLKVSAEQGSLVAQLCLGISFQKTGIFCDYGKAMHWLHKAADVNFHKENKCTHRCYKAQYYIGKLHVRDLNYVLGLQYFTKSAKNGNAAAMYEVGVCYLHGKGVQQDNYLASHWLLKSAENEYLPAQVRLAQFYLHTGVPGDMEESMYWSQKGNNVDFHKASGYVIYCPETQYFIGKLCTSGIRDVNNCEMALQWFLKSAENGHTLAMYEVGMIYLDGNGVQKRGDLARYWLTQSAERGFVDAQLELGVFYQTPSDLTDYKKSMHWLRKAADNISYKENSSIEKCYEAEYWIGKLHKYGVGRLVDINLAFEWFMSSAKNGNGPAMYEIAYDWFTKSAELDYLPAQIFMLKKDPSDPETTFYWEQKVSNINYHKKSKYARKCYDIQLSIGKHYKTGLLVPVNSGMALQWFMKSAENGNRVAMCTVGLIYLDGEELEKQEELACHWLTQSAERGYIRAQFVLRELYKTSTALSDHEKSTYWYKKALESKEDYVTPFLTNSNNNEYISSFISFLEKIEHNGSIIEPVITEEIIDVPITPFFDKPTGPPIKAITLAEAEDDLKLRYPHLRRGFFEKIKYRLRSF
ncbi:hypothetical protein INT47_005766 [Mucor saturninus]|uniref:HCP-like protein n=1 Tax=Mucor saturninus TaxID=64648 RepID=A0A8H7UZ58_9FUNG|nr:hypothetical protein INT47_005766 [Mucor saturninus]